MNPGTESSWPQIPDAGSRERESGGQCLRDGIQGILYKGGTEELRSCGLMASTLSPKTWPYLQTKPQVCASLN